MARHCSDIRELSNMEALSAKLLHDVSGVVSAIVTHVECVMDDIESDSVREVLEDVLEDAVLRFRLIRHAYGTTSDNVTFNDTKDRLGWYLKKKGIAELKWDVKLDSLDAENREIANRFIIHAVLFSTMIMVQGKAIEVSATEDGGTVHIRLKLLASEVAVHREVEDIFSSGNYREEQLSTHNVQLYFMLLLLERHGAKLKYVVGSPEVEITLPVC